MTSPSDRIERPANADMIEGMGESNVARMRCRECGEFFDTGKCGREMGGCREKMGSRDNGAERDDAA